MDTPLLPCSSPYQLATASQLTHCPTVDSTIQPTNQLTNQPTNQPTHCELSSYNFGMDRLENMVSNNAWIVVGAVA
jgi:hypothetical protein